MTPAPIQASGSLQASTTPSARVSHRSRRVREIRSSASTASTPLHSCRCTPISPPRSALPSGVVGVPDSGRVSGRFGEGTRRSRLRIGSPVGSLAGPRLLAGFGEQAADPLGGAAVSFDVGGPAAFGGINGKGFFGAQAVLQSWSVLGWGRRPEPTHSRRARWMRRGAG